ncbi:hypothetical protein B0J13DRAFT_110580 [Dactylonectria estremocensis]|uniref:RNA polymerase II assembly factor Rtp1 C-terminal domain-containing protein n=1 Tax=Dactylonectria estremocensis TaxID=1079267 RepID=A0A9P9FEV7_9HYPO|nr:hypothetical protein B0J13DRAFT_110580 [Dactylonectria estremocensis]
MASSSSSQNSTTKIIETIVEAGKKAFDPNVDAAARASGVDEYNRVIESMETWALLPALNTLIKPNVLPPWLRDPLLQTLTRLPLREDGVRGTMEFVFSVHPSNVGKAAESSSAAKQGAAITHEAVAVATRLLSSVPASMTPRAWFSGISEQLLQLMDGEGGLELAKTAAQVVGYGILGRKQYGAPGTAGWDAFIQPLVENLNPSLAEDGNPVMVKKEEDEIIDLSQDKVLVKPGPLKISLQRLSVLLLSNPSPGLCKRVLRPILLQLWTLVSWSNPLPLTEQDYVNPARTLLQAYLRLFGNADNVMPLIQNLLCKGSPETTERPWKYRLTGKGDLDLVEPRALDVSNFNINWNELEEKSLTLVNLIISTCSAEEVSSIFLGLLRRWVQTAGKHEDDTKVNIRIHDQDQTLESPIKELVEVTVLQKLIEKAPEKLVSHFDQLVELICQVFKADAQSPLGDDLVAVILSLLNLVVTAPTFQKSHIKPEELRIIETSLATLSQADRAQVSPTAKNLSLLLKYRDELNDPDEPTSVPNNRQIEDRKTYNLAMSYVTGGEDNPPPVVSEGINLLSDLIMAESPILDIPAVTVLMSNLLSDNEDFINLRVIKIFTQLANKHPKATIQELLDHYLDAQEKSSTDVRLRFGEALLQVIQRLGDTFTGDIAQQVSETLLSIAGRRGYRPKTMAKQARDEKVQKMKKKEVDDAGAGGLLDENEEMKEEDRARDDILAQILQGWESKRGSEDVRIRASSLSVFGCAIETNIGGIGPALVSASVDLCISVLSMEREMETAILRRAAILNVLSFVRALDAAKESGRSLGFGLTNESRDDILRTLRYVAGTDNDGLVQQHAKDVIESLETWQMASMMPSQNLPSRPELTSLAGLHVNPSGTLVDSAGRPRPRIEEVE